jgi:hypothetical protein
MQRKTDLRDLDIPHDDIECWERYPKFHWVYDLSRVLDAQHIEWKPYYDKYLPDRELTIHLETESTLVRQSGFIYTHKPEGTHLITEVFIVKGEIKFMRHIDPITNAKISSLVGGIELRLNAFVTIHWSYFVRDSLTRHIQNTSKATSRYDS